MSCKTKTKSAGQRKSGRMGSCWRNLSPTTLPGTGGRRTAAAEVRDFPHGVTGDADTRFQTKEMPVIGAPKSKKLLIFPVPRATS